MRIAGLCEWFLAADGGREGGRYVHKQREVILRRQYLEAGAGEGGLRIGFI